VAETDTSICNGALIKLGAQTILSLDDANDTARRLKVIYPRSRDKLLASHPWNFATKRAVLAEDPTPPSFDFSHRFALPPDCLRVYGTDLPQPQEWAVEDGFLLCNSDMVSIKYIFRQEDTSKYSATFADCLSSLVAFDAAYGITQSASLKEAMNKYFKDDLAVARSFNGQEGAGDRVYADSWLNSRL
jgi:hypothetical protein